jgi:hypothetical protein
VKKLAKKTKGALGAYWRRGLWQKTLIVGVGAFVLCLGTMYGIAQWYIAGNKDKPMTWGVTFIPAYAESFGLNAQETMDALITDVGVRHFRLVSYWDQLEPEPGKYDFSLLDWQFDKAEASGSKISLGLGLRQPRWPECHMPGWARSQSVDQWQPELEKFITATVNRYKKSPALDSYQLENEFFLKGFGECDQIPGSMERWRLVQEFDLVKKLDATHKVIIARSNNALGVPVGEPTPDEFGISIYKRVWDATLTHRYLEYPFPAWYYGFVAGTQKIVTGRDMIIHELQAESWGPNGQHLNEISLEEANKSFDAERFRDRVKFAEGTGMREAYLWGAEYWYHRLKNQNDPSLWNVAKEVFPPQEPKKQ